MLEKLKELDCHQALRVSRVLSGAGIVIVLLGIAIGAMADSTVVMMVIGILGFILEISSIVLGVRLVRCPKCAGFLGDMPRLPSEIPNYCPHCGERL